MNKKLLSLILLCVLTLLLLCSCGKAANENQSAETNPAPTESVATDTPAQSDAPESAIGWVDAEIARFYVPEGFTESDYEGQAKAPDVYPYSYTRPDLDMTIDVARLAAPETNIGESWFEDSYDYYLTAVDVTYNTISENSFTISGYADDNVYYIYEAKTGDQGLEVSITYPGANKDVCDGIVEDFIKSLSFTEPQT